MEPWYICAIVGFIQALSVHANPPNPGLNCRGPLEFTKHPRECCRIPDIFEEQAFIDCGFQTREKISKEVSHGPPPPPDCKRSVCVLAKYKLLKFDDELDKDKFAVTIDEWADAHPEWKQASLIVKDRCLSDHLPGPPEACEVDKALFCTTLTLIENCPIWENSDDCDMIKKHINECKGPY